MTWNPTPDQLLCRDLMHAWHPYTASRVGRVYVRELKCIRCGTVKVQALDLNGYILRSEYHYPSGYVNPGGGRMTKEVRAELRTANLAEWSGDHA